MFSQYICQNRRVIDNPKGIEIREETTKGVGIGKRTKMMTRMEIMLEGKINLSERLNSLANYVRETI